MTQPVDTKSPQRTLEQRRAANAWAAVENEAAKEDDKFKKKFGSLARSLPALVLSDGLGMTLAFLRAKAEAKNTHHEMVYKAISKWVVFELKLPVGDHDLLDWVVNTASTNAYRRATAEALAYLSWLKRFTEAKGWKSDESGD